MERLKRLPCSKRWTPHDNITTTLAHGGFVARQHCTVIVGMVLFLAVAPFFLCRVFIMKVLYFALLRWPSTCFSTSAALRQGVKQVDLTEDVVANSAAVKYAH